MGMPYNKENFLEKLAQGNETEEYVLKRLLEAGIEAERPEYPEGMPRKYYTQNQVDIVANEKIIEVKGSRYTFTGVEDFGYPDRFIEGVSGYEAKIHKPEYYINVSNPTGGMAVLNVEKTKDQWQVKNITDRTRGYSYDMYLCSNDLWMEWEQFILELKYGTN